VLAAIAVGGAVVGVFIQNKDAQARSDWHQETSEHLETVEQQACKRPDLTEQLKARREAGLARAEAAIQEQDASASRRNGASIGMGAMFGPK